MIRMYTPADEAAVIRIWLDASKEAHDFVEPGFWENRESEMRKEHLPQSEVWVYDDNMTGEVVGFVVFRKNYIVALFVEPNRQHEGIGFQLMEKVKGKHHEIELSVYKENSSAVAFYERQGFWVVSESIEPETKHPELRMRFKT